METIFTKKINHLFLILITVFAFQMNAMAQAPTFWSEDFAGGIPADWTQDDPSGNGTMWTWCNDPANDRADPGCPLIWNTPANQQSPFAATTALNGFITMDSDVYGNLGVNHATEITTSAIDCSSQSEVFIRIETHIGIFTVAAATGAQVRVSTNPTDTGSWTSYVPFPDMQVVGDPRWSENPQVVILDLSDAAAGNAEVYIQFKWIGNFEYFWNIDDITLHTADPTLTNDMRVNRNFFAVPVNARTPISQVTPIRFFADIENIGREDQQNVNLNVKITNLDNSMVVHEQDMAFGDIISDSLAENVFFPETFIPTEVGNYEGVYLVTSDSTDNDMTNNNQTFLFSVTDTVFSKSNGVMLGGIGPAGSNWAAGEAHSWGMGVHYYMPSGSSWLNTSVTFGLSNADEIGGEAVQIWLYKWNDEDNNGDSEIEERIPIGVNSYPITGDETINDQIQISLVDLNGNPEIPLEDNVSYILMGQFVAPDELTDLSFSSERRINYGATFFISDSLDAVPQYNSFGYIGEETTYSHNNFGSDTGPYMNLHINQLVSTNELAAENRIKVYPNPANQTLFLDLNFVNTMEDVQVNILDVSGKLIGAFAYKNLLDEQLRFDLGDYNAGSYMIQVRTTKGMRSERFVVIN